jgi:hypothetical protein
LTVTREQIRNLTGKNEEWLYRAANNPRYDVKISADGSIILVSRLDVMSVDELTARMEGYKTLTTKQ